MKPTAADRPVIRLQEGTFKNRRERSECKAHGAENPRHIREIGEGSSTAWARNRAAQQVFEGAQEEPFPPEPMPEPRPPEEPPVPEPLPEPMPPEEPPVPEPLPEPPPPEACTARRGTRAGHP